MTPGRRLKVLILGHSLVNSLNRQKLVALAQDPGLEICLIVPHRWTGSHGEEYAPTFPEVTPYDARAHRVFFRGWNSQHFYFYGPGISRLIGDLAPDLIHIEDEPYSVV